MDVSQYLEIFIDETSEHIQSLNDCIMTLEKEPENKDTINEIFRAAHSLKGMAGTMGFKRMQHLTHDMENVFQEVRSDKVKVTSEMIDILFQCLDAIESYLDTIKSTSDEGTEDNEALITALNKFLENAENGGAAAPAKEEKKEEKKAEEPKEHKKEHKKDKKLEELQNEINTLKDKNMRIAAEMVNTLRRKDEETNRLLKYSNESLITELLPVIDNFERALNVDAKTVDVESYQKGMTMIYNSLKNILEKFEVKEIEAIDKEFDPSFHQAVMQEEKEGTKENIVIEVLQKGYTYKDKVIRPAMVKVSK